MPIVPDGGGLLVPSIDPIGRSHGLLVSLEPHHLDDPHWQAGIEWESDCSVDLSSTLPSCPDDELLAPLLTETEDSILTESSEDIVLESPITKSTDGSLVFCNAEPFTVYGSYKCSTVGRPVSEAHAIALGRLKRNKERAIEQIFWTGNTTVGSVSPSLQGGNDSCGVLPVDLTPLAGALSTVSAIATLESAIADCIPGGVGVIHFNYGFLPYMASNYLVNEKDGKFYSPSGQLIIAGAGYPGTGPGNIPAAAGETWLFATGPMAVYESDIFYTANEDQSIDRRVNSITYIAEQTFSVIWECCLFAVRVALCV